MRKPQLGATREDPPPTLVRAELDRILASEIFSRSDRLSAFLKFIVEHTLNGQGDTFASGPPHAPRGLPQARGR